MNYRNFEVGTGNMWAKEETPEQKLDRVGIKGFSDTELIKLAIGDTRSLFADDVAKSVLKVFDKAPATLEGLFSELSMIRGLDTSKALALASMIEFARRQGNGKQHKSIMTPVFIFVHRFLLLILDTPGPP